MKKLVYVSVLVMVAALTGCASDETETRNYRYYGTTAGSCSDTLIKDESQPNACAVRTRRPAPVVQQAPAKQCNSGCPSREYTVRTPVRVVYKATTYHTVYEPRTYETTSYETRPYSKSEACSTGICPSNGRDVVTEEELFGR